MSDPNPPPIDDEARLAVRCQLGHADAWDELVRVWNPRLFAFTRRMVGDDATADDVVQNVWVRVVRSLGRLRDPIKLRAWMYRIARAAVNDRLRRQYRRRETAAVDGSVAADPPADDPSIDRWVESEATADAIRRLHPRDREVLVLFYFHDLSVGEVAEACGVREGTVKSRLARARGRIKPLLEPENER